ncbi:hypothetical protein BCR33DRAFT_767614 [Rhizoclosmatium globosum]|uniref:N-acetyltransferase domain-containing protein n=1 Tax=Rhizoclosmatium globosum TaxID=329046 RepID=A0A1Y2C2P4_9FUNG|nr:hypothetical protein BCR33DRAFT_767614 [Rhizoclosmatium globosum]|eukprot:ORY41313.1 hypothetical protein BCR33DRAFT_767614 [Rhizoclosmatium globosum]
MVPHQFSPLVLNNSGAFDADQREIVDAYLRIGAARALHFGLTDTTTPESAQETLEFYASPVTDFVKDCWLLRRGNDIVGFLLVLAPATAHGVRITCLIDPTLREYKDLIQSSLEFSKDWVKRNADKFGYGGEVRIQFEVLDEDTIAASVFKENGLMVQSFDERMCKNLNLEANEPCFDEIKERLADLGFAIHTSISPQHHHMLYKSFKHAFSHVKRINEMDFDSFVRGVIQETSLHIVVWDARRNSIVAAALVKDFKGEAVALDYIWVQKELRGRGVGGLLMRAVFAELKGRRYSKVELDMDQNNTTGARRLYEKVGMTKVHGFKFWGDVVVIWLTSQDGAKRQSRLLL